MCDTPYRASGVRVNTESGLENTDPSASYTVQQMLQHSLHRVTTLQTEKNPQLKDRSTNGHSRVYTLRFSSAYSKLA